jgi:hypothetical protein
MGSGNAALDGLELESVKSFLVRALLGASSKLAELALRIETLGHKPLKMETMESRDSIVLPTVELSTEAIAMRADLQPKVRAAEPELQPLVGSLQERVKRKW